MIRAVPLVCLNVGLVVFLGWLMPGPPDDASMKANTAVTFILVGLALACARSASIRLRAVGDGIAIVVGLIGLLVIGTEIGAVNAAWLDYWLIAARGEQFGAVPPMAVVAAINFVVISGLLLGPDAPGVRLGWVLVGGLSVSGVVWPHLITPGQIALSWPAALLFLYLAVAHLWPNRMERSRHAG